MKVTEIYCQNWPHLISNALKCVGGWGSAPDPAGGVYDAPPDPLIVRGNALSALGSLYFVSIFTSQFPFRAPLTEFLDPPLMTCKVTHATRSVWMIGMTEEDLKASKFPSKKEVHKVLFHFRIEEKLSLKDSIEKTSSLILPIIYGIKLEFQQKLL